MTSTSVSIWAMFAYALRSGGRLQKLNYKLIELNGEGRVKSLRR